MKIVKNNYYYYLGNLKAIYGKSSYLKYKCLENIDGKVKIQVLENSLGIFTKKEILSFLEFTLSPSIKDFLYLKLII